MIFNLQKNWRHQNYLQFSNFH